MKGWIGVDLDGTLAEYGHWVSATHIGSPIPLMVKRVQDWLGQGQEIRIFTARAYPLLLVHQPDVVIKIATGASLREIEAANAVTAIFNWSRQHIGVALPVTCIKDYSMKELWDDRARQVRPNTGEAVHETLETLVNRYNNFLSSD